MDPVTFTPEMVFRIGRVVDCCDKVVIEPLRRPGTVAVSFGGIIEDVPDVPEDEEYHWGDVLGGGWRVVT